MEVKRSKITKREKVETEEMVNFKKAVKELLSTSADINMVKAEMVAVIDGFGELECKQRNSSMRDQLGSRLSILEEFLTSKATDSANATDYVEVAKELVVGTDEYAYLLNASLFSRIVLVSGKEQCYERTKYIADGKVFPIKRKETDPREIGKKYEAEAYDKVYRSFNCQTRKCGLWWHRKLPFLSSQPDALLFKNGKAQATIEIKVLTKACHSNINADLAKLTKGSELGISINQWTNEFEVRRASAMHQQMQIQMLTTGVTRGYLCVYSPYSGAVKTFSVHRDEEMLNFMVIKAIETCPKYWSAVDDAILHKQRRPEIQIFEMDQQIFGTDIATLVPDTDRTIELDFEGDHLDLLLAGVNLPSKDEDDLFALLTARHR